MRALCQVCLAVVLLSILSVRTAHSSTTLVLGRKSVSNHPGRRFLPAKARNRQPTAAARAPSAARGDGAA
eukprot:5514658-Alexandrium_andersonii.AAC.1